MYICISIYVYLYIYIHTYTHIYIYRYVYPMMIHGPCFFGCTSLARWWIASRPGPQRPPRWQTPRHSGACGACGAWPHGPVGGLEDPGFVLLKDPMRMWIFFWFFKKNDRLDHGSLEILEIRLLAAWCLGGPRFISRADSRRDQPAMVASFAYQLVAPKNLY